MAKVIPVVFFVWTMSAESQRCFYLWKHLDLLVVQYYVPDCVFVALDSELYNVDFNTAYFTGPEPANASTGRDLCTEFELCRE